MFIYFLIKTNCDFFQQHWCHLSGFLAQLKWFKVIWEIIGLQIFIQYSIKFYIEYSILVYVFLELIRSKNRWNVQNFNFEIKIINIWSKYFVRAFFLIVIVNCDKFGITINFAVFFFFEDENFKKLPSFEIRIDNPTV